MDNTPDTLLVIQAVTVQQLQRFDLLEPGEPSGGYWIVKPGPHHKICPRVNLLGDKIPYACNTSAFLCYVGFEPGRAEQLLLESDVFFDATWMKMCDLAKDYIKLQWSEEVPNKDVMPVSDEANTIMANMGLTEVVREQVNDLYRRTEADPNLIKQWYNIKYLEESDSHEPFESKNLLDFIVELLDQRMGNLKWMDKWVRNFLH